MGPRVQGKLLCWLSGEALHPLLHYGGSRASLEEMVDGAQHSGNAAEGTA